MIVKIPKNDKNKYDKAKSFTSVKTSGTLLSALTARLFRFKSAFLEENKGDEDEIPQIFYPFPVVYELLDD